MKTKCPTCGSSVKVVGNVTKSYEPAEEVREVLMRLKAKSSSVLSMFDSVRVIKESEVDRELEALG